MDIISKICPQMSVWHHVLKLGPQFFFAILGKIHWHKLVLLLHPFPYLLSVLYIPWYCHNTLEGQLEAGTS